MKKKKYRDIIEECIGKNYSDYLDYRLNRQNFLFADIFSEIIDLDDEITNFSYKLEYYCDCFPNLSSEKNEIKNLFEVFIDLFENGKPYEFQSNLFILTQLAQEAGIPRIEIENFDNEIISIAEEFFRNEFQTLEFYKALQNFLYWQEFRVNDIYNNLSIDTTETELSFLKSIYSDNKREMERIKSELPALFLYYSEYIDFFYKRLPEFTDKNYEPFYKDILLSNITVCRNTNNLDYMSENIYKFQKVKYKERKFVSWFLDFFTGYGENPFRLIRLFLIFHIVFAMLFLFVPIFNLEKITDRIFIEKVVSIIYFNNTTMLTIGYGDIFPTKFWTKILVIFEQICGFITTGSLITLTLRKIFRF